jgi:hypothetical protein
MLQLFIFAGNPTRMHFCKCNLALCAILLMLFLGCSRGNQPELGNVHGRVTIDGKPLSGVVVSFQPIQGGRQSSGETDDQGGYELIYLRDIQGAKVGKHRVAVGSSDLVTPPKKRLPARYNAKTTLEAEVRPGDNEIDFPLTSL